MRAFEWQTAPVQQQTSLLFKSRWIGQAHEPPLDAVHNTFVNGAYSTQLKHDKTTTVVISTSAFAGHQNYVLKRYNPRNMWHRFSRSVRPTRAHRCWRMSFVFAQANIAVAEPIFMLERRFMGFRGTAFFAAKKVPGKELLSEFAHLSAAEQKRVVRAVKQLFDALEAHQLSHGDLKASNLLWDSERLWVIDLDAAQQHRSLHTWRKAHRKDRYRFLKNWQASPELAALFKF